MEIEMIEAPGTELTVQDRAALALGSKQTEADLHDLAAKNKDIVKVIDKSGREQAHGAAMELKRARTSIEKVSKDARDDANKFSKAVIAEEKRLIAIIEPEEARLVSLRDAWDAEQERIKRQAEEKERARITAIHQQIAEIRNYAALAAQCRTADRIAGLIEKLTVLRAEGFASFQEFGTEAEQALVTTMQTVTKLHTEKLDEEMERARVKAEQEAAAAKLAEERAALDKEKAEVAAARAAVAPQPVAAVNEFEQELQAFQAAVTQQPISSTHAGSETKAADLPNTEKANATRPTDTEIVDVLALHYRVHESKVLEWLLAMDLDAVSASIEADFV